MQYTCSGIITLHIHVHGSVLIFNCTIQSVCDVLNEAAASDSNVSDVHHVLKCLRSILSAPMLPPILHKFDIVVYMTHKL